MAEKKIKPIDDVTVYATAKTQFVKEGEPMVVHSVHADKLVASGKATSDKPKVKEAAAK